MPVISKEIVLFPHLKMCKDSGHLLPICWLHCWSLLQPCLHPCRCYQISGSGSGIGFRLQSSMVALTCAPPNHYWSLIGGVCHQPAEKHMALWFVPLDSQGDLKETVEGTAMFGKVVPSPAMVIELHRPFPEHHQIKLIFCRFINDYSCVLLPF